MERVLHDYPDRRVLAFVVWEPVLPTDWSSPSTATLARIPDLRASQYWDKQRLISHAMGEHDRRSVVWDHIAVYPPGAIWQDRPPSALYEGGPVVSRTQQARAALAEAMQEINPSRQSGARSPMPAH